MDSQQSRQQNMSNVINLSTNLPHFLNAERILPMPGALQSSYPVPHGSPIPGPPPRDYTGVDLAEISRGALDISPTGREFKFSESLQIAIRERTLPCNELAELVERECMKHAIQQKQDVRVQLKNKLHGVQHLTARDKGKLRSRREAKVHRVKEQAFERALKEALRWMIENSITHPEPGPSASTTIGNTGCCRHCPQKQHSYPFGP